MSDAARRFTAFEADGWSARARSYGDLSERITAQVADALLDAGGVAAGTRVLDVGCGPGVVVAAALARGAWPTGVDVAAGMLDEARRRHPDVELVEADVVELPFEGGAFGAAVGNFVLGGSVRTSAAILARPPEEQGRARAALARLAEAYRGPGGLVLPVEVVIGSASRAEHDVVDVERGAGDG